MVDVGPGLVAAGIVGVVVAVLVLRHFRTELPARRAWPELVAVAVALVTLPAVLYMLADQTRHFRQRGLTEVGSAAFEEPPMGEPAARAMQDALRPGDTWAVVYPEGRCEDDTYAHYWLAFRLVPNVPDCDDPDLALLLDTAPPGGADVVARGDNFAVVRG